MKTTTVPKAVQAVRNYLSTNQPKVRKEADKLAKVAGIQSRIEYLKGQIEKWEKVLDRCLFGTKAYHKADEMVVRATLALRDAEDDLEKALAM